MYRAQTGYYTRLEEMAAALFESLLINHAFADGNIRVAFFATDVFLRQNEWKLVVTADGGEQFIVGMLDANDRSFDKIVAYAYAGQFYPMAVRSTGIGWASGAGQSGGILAPIVIGGPVDMELSLQQDFMAMAILAIIAFVAVWFIDHGLSWSVQPELLGPTIGDRVEATSE